MSLDDLFNQAHQTQTLAPPPINFKRVYVVHKEGKVTMYTDNLPVEFFRKYDRIWRIDNHKTEIDWYVRLERGIFYHRQIKPCPHESFNWKQLGFGCGGCSMVLVSAILMCALASAVMIKAAAWLDRYQ